MQSNPCPAPFGHGAATSAKTGRVKCFVYSQTAHFQARDFCSAGSAPSIFFKTESAWFRIDFRAKIVSLCAASIDRVPAVEVSRISFAVIVPTKSANIVSCSFEHNRWTEACADQILQSIRWASQRPRDHAIQNIDATTIPTPPVARATKVQLGRRTISRARPLHHFDFRCVWLTSR